METILTKIMPNCIVIRIKKMYKEQVLQLFMHLIATISCPIYSEFGPLPMKWFSKYLELI